MNRIVHATTARGASFHNTAYCPSFHTASQEFWNTDCADNPCTHKHPRPLPLREMTMAEALGMGKWPCSHCYPDSSAALVISPCEEDFGHVPVDEYEGTEYAASGVTHIVCDRCIVWSRLVDDIMSGIRVEWPCTSALILGLVPRNLQDTQ